VLGNGDILSKGAAAKEKVMTEVLLPLLLALIAATPGIISLWKGRKKEEADAAAVFTGAARELVEEYRAKIDEIEKTVEEQEAKIRCQDAKIDQQNVMIRRQQREMDDQAKRIYALEVERSEFIQGVSALCAQIRGLGHEPVWEPE